jgi:hypothetical protein
VGDRSRLAAAGGGGATTATSVGISLLDNEIVFRSSPTPFGYA